MKKALLAITGILFFVFGLWFIAVPESLIQDIIENSLSKGEIYIRAEGLNKGFFYNLTINKILLNKKGSDKNSDITLLVLNDIGAGINFISLLKLNPALKFHCTLNGGMVDGEAEVIGRARSARAIGNNIDIKGIGVLEHYGIRGIGKLSFDLHYSRKSGELKLNADDVRLENTSVNGSYLPLSLFRNVRGALAIRGETVNVQSFTLEGNGVRARVKGSADKNKTDMNLELMMDASFRTEPLLRMMLEQYRVSPGYYVIPLRT